jgi:hypothetical protein
MSFVCGQDKKRFVFEKYEKIAFSKKKLQFFSKKKLNCSKPQLYHRYLENNPMPEQPVLLTLPVPLILPCQP